MTTETLERPRTTARKPAPQRRVAEDEPNFGPEDRHAIAAIFGLMVSIFCSALVMYGLIAIFAT